jgi:hypothetical protein
MKRTPFRALKAYLGWAPGLLIGLLSPLMAPTAAHALPGFFAGKDAEQRISRSTQVVVMSRDDQSVVSVMTDYDGPSQPFALVMPVPKDVTLASVKTLKRVSVERLDELTSPRFHEFWEKDPCEPGKAEQIWEQSMVASESTDFLGAGAQDMFKGATKAAPEMREVMEPDFRVDGSEYAFFLVPDDIQGWLSGKGYQTPAGLSLDAYAGMAYLVAIVDPAKVELGKKGEALLSPIRYTTKQPVKIASTLGKVHMKGFQELVVYTINPKQRFEVARPRTCKSNSTSKSAWVSTTPRFTTCCSRRTRRRS